MQCEMTARKDGRNADAEHAGGEFHWAFRADAGAVREALGRVVAWFSCQMSEDEAGTLELALAEVLNNVVEHGYAGLDPGPVNLCISRGPDGLSCRISDRGNPMPGLKLPDGEMQPVADEIEDMAEGGWGWAMIRELTRDLTYQRGDQSNCVSFRLPITPN